MYYIYNSVNGDNLQLIIYIFLVHINWVIVIYLKRIDLSYVSCKKGMQKYDF